MKEEHSETPPRVPQLAKIVQILDHRCFDCGTQWRVEREKVRRADTRDPQRRPEPRGQGVQRVYDMIVQGAMRPRFSWSVRADGSGGQKNGCHEAIFRAVPALISLRTRRTRRPRKIPRSILLHAHVGRCASPRPSQTSIHRMAPTLCCPAHWLRQFDVP